MKPAAVRRAVLEATLGPDPDTRFELVGAINRPPASGNGTGTWSERRFRSLEELVNWTSNHAEECETYVALARFSAGAGARKAAVVAKACISADVDAVRMPGPNHAEQARQLVNSLPCPKIVVASGGGYHPHLLLPPDHVIEHYVDVEDGVRHVEILGLALRLYLEDRARKLLGSPVELDHCHGAQRVWRIPPGWNLKAAPDSRELTADRAVWRPVRLIHPGRAEELEHIAPADLSFLIPFIRAAEDHWEARAGRNGGGAATVAGANPKKQASDGSTVAVALGGQPYFDPDILPHGLRKEWPMRKGDQSAHDWKLCVALAEEGWSPAVAWAAIQARRTLLPDPQDRAKGNRLDYVGGTVGRAYEVAAPGAATPPVGGAVPFPLGVVPEPIERYVAQGAQALGASPEAILLPLLASMGAAIGNTRRVQIKTTWTEPPLLWVCVVMPSGKLKSPAQHHGLLAFLSRHADWIRAWHSALEAYEVEKLRYEVELRLWKQKKDVTTPPPEKPVEPSPRRLIVSDTTLEALVQTLQANPRGLLLVRDELAGWFKSHDAYRQGRGGDLQQWLSVFGARDLTVDRKGDRAVHFVPYAFVAICGGIQPGTLRRNFTREVFDTGAPARFLFAMPDAPPRRWSDAEVPPAVINALDRVVQRLLGLSMDLQSDGSFKPCVLPFTAGAKALWIEFYNEMGAKLENRAHGEDIGAALSKLEGYAARLALIFCLCRWASGPEDEAPNWVDEDSLRSAIEAVRWFEQEASRVYSMLDADADARQRDELVDWIRARGGPVSVRQVQRGPLRLRVASKDAAAALHDLVARGYGWWLLLPPPPQGGRARRLFELRDDGGPPGDGDSRSDTGPFHAGLPERLSRGGEFPDAPTDAEEGRGAEPSPSEPAATSMSVAEVAAAVDGGVVFLGPAPPSKSLQTRRSSTCRACHGTDLWASPHRAGICRRCHPPAPDAEVAS